jgi:hypothetical protein
VFRPITSDARYTHEIASSFVVAKTAFHKKKALFASELGVNLRKKPAKCNTGTWLCVVLKFEHF